MGAVLDYHAALTKDLEDRIVGCDALMDRLKGLKILNVEYTAKEQRVFTLSRSPSLPVYVHQLTHRDGCLCFVNFGGSAKFWLLF